MSDDYRYREHMERAVPRKRLLQTPHHTRVIDACLKHRYGNLPTKVRQGYMTFYLTVSPEPGWHLSVHDGKLLEYMEFGVTETEDVFEVRGGGLTINTTRFCKRTLERLP